MDWNFLIFGGVLAVMYNHMTTTKKEYKKLGLYRSALIIIFIFFLHWIGLVVSICLDVKLIKKKLNNL